VHRWIVGRLTVDVALAGQDDCAKSAIDAATGDAVAGKSLHSAHRVLREETSSGTAHAFVWPANVFPSTSPYEVCKRMPRVRLCRN
jgi:hypothetical protein